MEVVFEAGSHEIVVDNGSALVIVPNSVSIDRLLPSIKNLAYRAIPSNSQGSNTTSNYTSLLKQRYSVS